MQAALAMSVIKINGVDVSFEAANSSIDLSDVLSYEAFQEWLSLIHSDIHVKSILVTHLVYRSGKEKKRLFLVVLKVVAFFREEKAPLPENYVIRCGAVQCLIELECEGKSYVVMVRQPRLAIGKRAFDEFVCGKVDDYTDIKGNIVREVEEEAGMHVRREDVLDLNALAHGPDELGIYDSVGMLSEWTHMFLFRATVPPSYLLKLQGVRTGLVDEGEYIGLNVFLLDDVWTFCSDSRTLAALYLREQLLRTHKLPPPVPYPYPS